MAVTKWRQRAKRTLVTEHGGKCVECGYDKCVAALSFHHRDPAAKSFGLGSGCSFSLERQRAEASKCDLLCANCHMEKHWHVDSMVSRHPVKVKDAGSNPAVPAVCEAD